MMILNMIFFIITLLVSTVFTSSIHNDCDSLYAESEDKNLERFLNRHDLQHDYERRNENFDACLQFLEKFFSLTDEFRREGDKPFDLVDDDGNELIIKNKRAYKKPKNKFSFKY